MFLNKVSYAHQGCAHLYKSYNKNSNIMKFYYNFKYDLNVFMIKYTVKYIFVTV